jgi:hypothetical protein
MKIFKKTLIAATFLLSIASAQAALVESDWKSAGDALATLDTETGIEWLDLSQTDDMSISQVNGQFSTTLEGWRLPTANEVYGLFDNHFSGLDSASIPIHSTRGKINAVTDADVFEFMNKLGVTYSVVNNVMASGIYLLNDVVYQAASQYYDGDNYTKMNKVTGSTYSESNPLHGVYLVSDGGTTLSSQNDPSINANNAKSANYVAENVSAPTLLGLMSLGLFGFAARRRNAK